MTVIHVRPQAHASFSPSSDSLWNCAGCFNLTKDLPGTTSEAARIGTAIHDAVHIASLAGDDDVVDYLDSTLREDPRVVTAGRKCLQAVARFTQSHPHQVSFEKRIEIGKVLGAKYAPHVFGTADFVGYDGQSEVVCLDHKTGNHFVHPQAGQLQRYCVGLLPMFPKAERFRCVIVGPNFANGDEFIFEHVWTREHIEFVAQSMRDFLDVALSDNAPRTPGAHCRYCKGAGQCPENNAELLSVIGTEFDLEAEVSPAQVRFVVENAKRITEFVTATIAFATKTMRDGKAIPGLKLVAGPTTRTWRDAQTAQQELIDAGHSLDAIAPRALLSPAKAEKLSAAAKEIVAARSGKAAGAPTAVPVADRRKEWSPSQSTEQVLGAAPEAFDID